MRSDYAAWLHSLTFGLLLQLILKVDRAAADNSLTCLEAIVDLPSAILFQPDFHLAPLEGQRLPFDPDHGDIGLRDYGFDRNRKRTLAIADQDFEAGKHFRFERTVGIGDFRAHHHPTCRRVGRRADGGDARPEDPAGKRRDPDLDLLPDPNERAVKFGHVRFEPHGGQIRDGVKRFARIASHILARADFSADDRAVDLRIDGDQRIDDPLPLYPLDFSGITADDDSQAIAGRCQRAFGSPEVEFGCSEFVLRLIDLAL